MGIETAALVAAVGSTALGVTTAISSSQQQSKMADYQAAQAATDAQTAVTQAQVQAAKIRTATARQQAEARANLAGSGVVVGQGTAEQIDQTIDQRGDQDALTAIYGGTTKAYQITTAGNLASAQASNASTASLINGASTALGGFATVAKGWNVKTGS